MLTFIYRLCIFSSLLLPTVAQALVSNVGAASVATNLMEPVSILANFISSISITLGICFSFAGVIKYLQHRVNPLAIPISTVVLLFVMGAVLICLPLAYRLSETGLPSGL